MNISTHRGAFRYTGQYNPTVQRRSARIDGPWKKARIECCHGSARSIVNTDLCIQDRLQWHDKGHGSRPDLFMRT